jgi:hypothetical protein
LLAAELDRELRDRTLHHSHTLAAAGQHCALCIEPRDVELHDAAVEIVRQLNQHRLAFGRQRARRVGQQCRPVRHAAIGVTRDA